MKAAIIAALACTLAWDASAMNVKPSDRLEAEVCGAEAIYAEARGEPEEGQWAVMEVILTRVADPRWPSTVCGVVYQSWQFSAFNDGPVSMDDATARNRALRIARTALMVFSLPKADLRRGHANGASHYARKEIRNHWTRAMMPIAKIGDHVFYYEVK